MNDFLVQMAEIFEVDSVEPTDVLSDFEAWDSLTQLSIIALASETYKVVLSVTEIKEARTIGAVKNLIENKK